MRAGLIKVKTPVRTAKGISLAYRWVKASDSRINFPIAKIHNNNSSYIESLKGIALSKVKSDLYLTLKDEKTKDNVLSEGLAFDKQYGGEYGKYGLAIYLNENPDENQENLLCKANILNPLVISSLEKLSTPEDIFIFNILNVSGDPEGDEFLGEEFTKKVMKESIDCVIWKNEKGIFEFAVYNPGHIKIIIREESEE